MIIRKENKMKLAFSSQSDCLKKGSVSHLYFTFHSIKKGVCNLKNKG